MKRLTQERAGELRQAGYTHIASVVRRYKYTTYWHVNAIDAILANGGKWIPAPRCAWGRIGITSAALHREYPGAGGTRLL